MVPKSGMIECAKLKNVFNLKTNRLSRSPAANIDDVIGRQRKNQTKLCHMSAILFYFMLLKDQCVELSGILRCSFCIAVFAPHQPLPSMKDKLQ